MIENNDATIYNWIAKNWRDLIKPANIEIDEETASESYCKFICEPLESQYGVTIGNSLRRVILSSLQGTAVTAIKIEGVLHEFSAISNIVEDVTDIILNIKGVLFKKPNPKPVILEIDMTGPCVVTASDIGLVDSMEIMNPNHKICTITEGGSINMRLSVKTGRGYIQSEIHKDDTLGVGSIPIDAIFSPVKKVNFTVSNARVGQRTDFDKLVMEITTDGTVDPRDGIAYASKILKEHLQIFINFKEHDEPVEEEETSQEKEINQSLFKSVDELELSVRSANCLQNADIKHIGQLVQKTEIEMLKTKNFGRKSLKEIKEILTEMGLSLGMKIDWWSLDGPPPKSSSAPKK
jgi:DNA-directed RNA polymerase subunit alpha